MALKSGSVSNFNDSMAAAMDQAFQDEWSAVKGEPLPAGGEQERKILFAAVAQGMLSYLSDNINASLNIDVAVTQETGNQITSSGSSVTVTQSSGSSNRVESEGQATNVELLIE
jgi:hypothetical protein